MDNARPKESFVADEHASAYGHLYGHATNKSQLKFLVAPNESWNLDELHAQNTSDYYDDYYEYDYNASVNSWAPLQEFIPVILVYGLTFVLGLVGNVLVIFATTRSRGMRSVTNVFLVSLASADLLLILICVPVKAVKWFTFTWTFGKCLCKIVHYMQNVSVICSVLTLTGISVERYYAILNPIKSKSVCTEMRAKKMVIVIWIASLILATPILYGQVLKEVGVKRKASWCIEEWPSPPIEILYDTSMLLLILIIPVSVMTVSYTSICIELWIMSSRRASMQGSSEKLDCDSQLTSPSSTGSHTMVVKRLKVSVDDDCLKKQVVKMLVAVIVLFILCWAPRLIDDLLVSLGVLDRLHYGWLKPMRQAFLLMSYVNSCINPIVYCFMSRNFRESFRYALCACVHGKAYARNYRYQRQASLHTRSASLSLSAFKNWMSKRESDTEPRPTQASRPLSLPTDIEKYDKAYNSVSVI